MSNKGQMLQDPFLNTLRKEHVQVSIYLVNGIKLQGQIESFDQYVVLLKNTVTQMVYKHAISTVVPARPVAMPHHAPNHERDLTRSRAGASRRADDAARCRATACLTLMFERPTRGNRALLVALDFGDDDREYRTQELDELAASAGAMSSAPSRAAARGPIPRTSRAAARSTRSTRAGARPPPTS